MARIPDDELRRLKEEVDLAALVGASGVELKPIGRDLRGRCPFHEDKGPSLVVTPAKNLWHCLGACGTGGTAIDWVMKRERVSFRHAVEILRARPGSPAPAARPARKLAPKLPPPVALDADDRALLRQVVGFYHETLKQSPEALAYLASRGLKSSEMVERFKLGYANRTLGYRLPPKVTKAGLEIRTRLAKVGLYRQSGHEHFAGSLVIPILGPEGEVLGAYARKIRDDLREGTPKHLYLPGPHQGVWNVEALAASREIILCEAIIDALTFWCAGLRNVTASYGVHGFTADHLEAFRKHGVQRVLIAYDGDDAGDRAADELAPRLAEAGFDVARVVFPGGTDANEYARSVPDPAEALGVLVRSAEVVLKGKCAPGAAPSAEPPSPSAAASELRASGDGSTSLTASQDQVDLVLGDRAYRVRGLAKNTSPEQLRLNVRVSRGERYHVDTLDLFSARQRALWVKQAALELAVKDDVVKKDLGRLLFELEALQERRIAEATKPKDKTVELSEAEKAEALALLRQPDLLEQIVRDFEKIGVIGEETNALVGYLAVVSRKMDAPLALLIQSNSAAGKSTLLEAILELAPPEDVERYTAMTGQSLFYMAGADLKHRILAIAEVAGVEKAGYAIKMLQSEGRISIATTVKDPETGELATKKHEVEGPVAIMLTTTEAEVDEELQNRAVVLSVNEDREQTRAIHEAQRARETLEGMLARAARAEVLRLHRNAQRLLKPILVVNPYARQLTFLDTKLRARRDHVKYLTLMKAIALLFQHQRPVKTAEHHGKTLPYLEVTLSDVAIANRLAGEVLGRSLDELAPQTRRLLVLLDRLVTERSTALKLDREDCRFSRREAREHTGWGATQLRVHLARLVELEYVLVHRGGRGQSFVYELLYDGGGQDGGRFVVGLIDPKHLYDGNLAGSGSQLAAPWRPQSGGLAGGWRGAETAADGSAAPPSVETRDPAPGTHGTGGTPEKPVVHAGGRAALAAEAFPGRSVNDATAKAAKGDEP